MFGRPGVESSKLKLIFDEQRTKQEMVQGQLSRNGHPVLLLRTTEGLRSMDSPYDPEGEMRRLVSPVVREGDRVLAFGSGSGYLLSELERLRISEALILSGCHQLVKRNGIHASSRKLKGIYTIVAANNPEVAWKDHVSNFLESGAPPVVIQHPREVQAFPLLFGPLSVSVEKYKKPFQSLSSGSVSSILMPGRDGLFEPELRKQFRACGVDVTQVIPVSGQKLKPDKAWSLLHEHQPDLVFSTDNQGSDGDGLFPCACEKAGVPWATWFLDDPQFVLSSTEIQGMGRHRIGFHWDKNGDDVWKGMGFKQSELLPLATDPERFYPGKGRDDLKGRVVLIASPRFASSTGYFAALDSDPEATDMVNLLYPEVMKKRKPPSPIRIEEALIELNIDSHFRGESLRRLPAYILQEANRFYRMAAIKALAPLKPVLYGPDWEWLVPDGVEWRGPADYNHDLPEIYRSDAVHISLTNLQMRSYPNQRVFDVGACGRCLLNDKLDGWQELFGDGLDDILFESMEELRDKVSEYCGSPGKRQQVGDQLQEIVSNQHTIRNRAERILKVIKKKV